MAPIDLALPRLQRARELVSTADKAFAASAFASALMLYIPALEMIESELNQQLDLGAFIRQHPLHRRSHQLRHFSAAAIFVADALSAITDEGRAEVDFTKLSFARQPREGASNSEADWWPRAETSRFMSMLGSMVSPNFTFLDMDQDREGWAAAMNVKNSMYFLGCASLGFVDNQRIALLHEDNAFAFETYHADGSKTGARSPDLAKICEDYSLIVPIVLAGLHNQEVVHFLEGHLKNMMLAFKGPLKCDSYSRTEPA